ncbi:hypothetical protein DZA50_00550 [Kangiella sp. HD9-110m-PIT-SAG07]|nr:hypothetical protein DZA50_00550 [Kangiella sp. HD9-110m-PIT-SAG07]
MKNKVVWILLIASLGFNAYLLTKASKNESLEPLPKRASESFDNSANAKAKAIKEKTASKVILKEDFTEKAASQSHEENRQLKAKIVELEEKLKSIKAPGVKFSARSDSEVSNEMIKKSENIIALFDTEAVDHAWSNDTKNKLDQMFVENGLSSDIQIKDMTCKTTVCKLSISPYSGSSQGHLMGAGMTVIEKLRNSEQSSIANMHTIFNLNTDSEQVDIFLHDNN